MKTMIRKAFAALLTLGIIISLFPISVFAYVGAMTQDSGNIASGSQNGYYYLTNDYIGFYIRPGGNTTTVPSQYDLSDVKDMSATEKHVFYERYTEDNNPVLGYVDHIYWNTELDFNYISTTIDSSDADNPKLVQRIMVPSCKATLDITYEIVRLDAGETTDTVTEDIIEADPNDSGTTWGVMASAICTYGSNADEYTTVVWETKHVDFGTVAHDLQGTVRLDRYRTTYEGSTSTTTFYSGSIASGLSRTETDDISEAFTDSFLYANQFVGMEGYMNGKAGVWNGTETVYELIAGIRGHMQNYSSHVEYVASTQNLNVAHQLSGSNEAYALWGFRDLYAESETNIPADPVNIDPDATCIGIIIRNNGTVAAIEGTDKRTLKNQYGNKLAAVFQGEYDNSASGFIFRNGVQMAPSLTASNGTVTVADDGTVTAVGISLSSPSFKFYQPTSSSDSSLNFSFSKDDGVIIDINPNMNQAVLHLDIPGATSILDSVEADMSGGLIFSGLLSLYTPGLDAADISMTKLGMGWIHNIFTLTGIEASGSVDMSELLGMDTYNASAEINTFSGEQYYHFKMDINVFDMFEAEGELELVTISSGALIPNTLDLYVASEVGIPLVPPVVVAELNGLGGGFENLADTVDGNFAAMPPILLHISAAGSVLDIIEGKCTATVGAGYFGFTLEDGTLLEMDIINEYGWDMHLSGATYDYYLTPGVSLDTFTGMEVAGGMNVALSLPSLDYPFMEVGGEVNATAFVGTGDNTYSNYALVQLDADGKVYGVVKIPKEAWFFNSDLTLANKKLDFTIGGKTLINANSNSFEELVKEAFGSAAGYGSVSYSDSFLFIPYRMYYIFNDKEVGIEVGEFWSTSISASSSSSYLSNRAAVMDSETGDQVGLLVMNDNVALMASSKYEDTGVSQLSVGTNEASGSGVDISEITGSNEQSYQVIIDGSAPDTDYLAFSLEPKDSYTGTIGNFEDSLIVQKSGEADPLTLIPAEIDSNGDITNENTANYVVGENCITLKLPSNGTWTITSSGTYGTAFDISCYYSSPFASLTNMDLTGADMTGTVQDMDSGTNYILRTYLGIEQGGTDYMISESEALSSDSISETLVLSGGTAPTGTYYVTTILLEEVTDDFDGDGTDETTYITTDTYEFSTTVNYTNSIQPDAPTDVTLTATGSEIMQVTWKAPTGGNTPDGYYVRLYQQDGSDWVETGAGYKLLASELTADISGYYTLDMAVTIGDETLHLDTDNTYKVGITSFLYIGDEDYPLESNETQSGGQYLAQASYPTLSYSPVPTSNSDGMKLLYINDSTDLTITSDIAADLVARRMDTDAVIAQTVAGTTLTFTTPDFTGALNIEITATDVEGDVTVDYLGLRFDDTPPIITLDSASFAADYSTGVFTATGVTESGATVTVADIVTNSGTNGATVDAGVVTADGDGVFTITGKLNAEDMSNSLSAADSASILMSASDSASNVSGGTFVQIVRAEYTSSGSGASSGGVTVVNTGDGVRLTVSGGSFLELNEGGTGVTLSTGDITLTFDNDAASCISSAAGTGDIVINIDNADISGLSHQARDKIGNRPVYDFTLTAGGTEISDLGGSVTISIPYELQADEDPNAVVIYYISDSGELQAVTGAYNSETGKVEFSATHFSRYAVGYNMVSFSDVAETDWYYDAVTFCAAREITTGTGENMFSPSATLTRGQFIVMLMRAYGIEADTDITDNFDDAGDTYYTGYLSAAKRLGISNGVGNNLFAPESRITRQDMFTLLYRALDVLGVLPAAGNTASLSDFSDADDISDYAEEAMETLVRAGIISGSGGGLDPLCSSIRAQMAQVLYNLLSN